MTTAPTTVAVVGGGMLGLTLAWRLQARGFRVTVLEAGPAPGGLAAPSHIGDFVWDRFYHVILRADRTLLALLEELGLESRVRWRTTRTGFYGGGRVHSLSSGFDFLRFPILSMSAKVRLGWFVLRAERIANGLALEEEPVDDWLRRHAGREVCDRFWSPLLASKLGDNRSRTSAAFIWSYIRRLAGARTGLRRRETLGYVEGGYAAILARLEEAVSRSGVMIRYRAAVREVRQTDGGVELSLAESVERFDHTVVTLAAPLAARLCPQLDAAERRRLHAVVYQGVLCASVLLRRPLGGYYLTNIADPAIPFTGVIEMTALVDRSAFGGRTLAYLPLYLPRDAAAWSWSDAEVRRRFLPGLGRMFPGVQESDVEVFQVERAREVQALPTLAYTRDALPPTRTSLRNVFLVNSAQIVNGTLNVNETVDLALRQAETLATRLVPAPRGRAAAPAGVGGG
jgi:protoporphyrinogen oxidase